MKMNAICRVASTSRSCGFSAFEMGGIAAPRLQESLPSSVREMPCAWRQLAPKRQAAVRTHVRHHRVPQASPSGCSSHTATSSGLPPSCQMRRCKIAAGLSRRLLSRSAFSTGEFVGAWSADEVAICFACRSASFFSPRCSTAFLSSFALAFASSPVRPGRHFLLSSEVLVVVSGSGIFRRFAAEVAPMSEAAASSAKRH